MEAIDIARRMAELNQTEEACRAYTLALHSGPLTPEEEMEGAIYILQSGGDYKVAYTCFLSLYNRGLFQEDCLAVMTEAFYNPNADLLKANYERACEALKKYPYLFRKDFPAFEDLPVLFYPFDDDSYLPFDPKAGRFGDYWKPGYQVISRNFFKDLENPILAKDVYSQYELEYLYDNVRPSEWVGRDNHVYLHYADWETFCARLQCLDIHKLLEDKKFVFLLGDEIAQYPIDFKARFSVDYAKFPVKPVKVREVHKLIWHTQLASHNGGDFFNEIFDGHPNLICNPSAMLERINEKVDELRAQLTVAQPGMEIDTSRLPDYAARVIRELLSLTDRTDKDLVVAACMLNDECMAAVDPAARIVPAIFLQPHFGSLKYWMYRDKAGRTVMRSDQYEQIQTSPIFQNFKYIKTFTPMRRITTSYGASIKFMQNRVLQYQRGELDDMAVINDALTDRVLNRSYMIDPEDRLYMDSRLVRFEDGKLNPKATFTALAAFLDLPYTESMTYCSLFGERDPESLEGNDLGFSPAAIYRTYDEYANDDERAFLEYFMRDAYETYGYDFMYYDGAPVDQARVDRWIEGFTTIQRYIRTSWEQNALPQANVTLNGEVVTGEQAAWAKKESLDQDMKGIEENWHSVAKTLLSGLYFVNTNGQPLHMMPKLELDPALLEKPLYR